jgi:carbon monoxide dehydrogenase subunit G
MDVARVVPCMPGAELVETIDENTWKANMKTKLGPISLVFRTKITREAVDEERHAVKLGADAREARGRGQAKATIESVLSEVEGGTRVDITTDVALSGAVAQYGRGVLEEVSTQLVDSFADNLRAALAPPPALPPEAVSGAPSAPAPSPTPRPSAAPAPQAVGGFSLVFRAVARTAVRAIGRLAQRMTRSGRAER